MWYPDTSSSSSPALNVSWKEIILCVHHLMSEIFQPFLSISFSIKNYENNMLVRLAVVSCFNGSFVRKNFARLLSSRAYLCAFLCADFNLTNASFLRKTKPCCCYPFGFWTSKRERINTENIHDGNATEKPVLTSLWSEIFILERR